MEQRIIFKIVLFTFKALNGLTPPHLSDLVKFYVPGRDLRSSSQKLLVVIFSKTKSYRYGDRAFSICAAQLWNDLLLHLRNCASFNVFKSNLETFLFKYTTTVHRKTTFTGLYTKWDSFTPRKYKMNLIRTLTYRFLRICSSSSLLQSALFDLKETLLQNGYPRGVLLL